LKRILANQGTGHVVAIQRRPIVAGLQYVGTRAANQGVGRRRRGMGQHFDTVVTHTRVNATASRQRVDDIVTRPRVDGQLVVLPRKDNVIATKRIERIDPQLFLYDNVRPLRQPFSRQKQRRPIPTLEDQIARHQFDVVGGQPVHTVGEG